MRKSAPRLMKIEGMPVTSRDRSHIFLVPRVRKEFDLSAPRHHRLLPPIRGEHAGENFCSQGPPGMVTRLTFWKGGCAMRVEYERCCGIDVHKKTVVAGIIGSGHDGQPQTTTRTFAMMTGELMALAQWLRSEGVRHVAMESTGVYWKPV
jgi:hypothetical protein